MAFADLAEFVKENIFLFTITIIMVSAMVYFLSAQIYEPLQMEANRPLPSVPGLRQQNTLEELPLVPISARQSAMQSLIPPGSAQHSVDSMPDSMPLSVRSAQLGLPDRDQARELALGIVNAVPELSRLPENVKAGVIFYTRNADGSITDIPESNASFTLEPGGRLRFGIVQGITIRLRMPLSRLQDLNEDFCNTLSDMMKGNEVDMTLDISAMDRIALLAASVPVRNRCSLP